MLSFSSYVHGSYSTQKFPVNDDALPHPYNFPPAAQCCSRSTWSFAPTKVKAPWINRASHHISTHKGHPTTHKDHGSNKASSLRLCLGQGHKPNKRLCLESRIPNNHPCLDSHIPNSNSPLDSRVLGRSIRTCHQHSPRRRRPSSITCTHHPHSQAVKHHNRWHKVKASKALLHFHFHLPTT